MTSEPYDRLPLNPLVLRKQGKEANQTGKAATISGPPVLWVLDLMVQHGRS